MRSRRSGQTLIIALLILFILLAIGVAFAKITSGNIRLTQEETQRAKANGLAKAGVESAMRRLRYSERGADYRPDLTPPTGIDANGFSRDPDALYLRPGSNLTVVPDPSNPGATVVDRGGPDYQGPFSRISYEGGRSLIRIRYTPADYDAFTTAGSVLRQPGKVRHYLVIESVGRAGEITTAGRIDPSLLLPEAVKVSNYADAADMVNSLGAMKAIDLNINAGSRKMMALASIGFIEQGRFITNKDNRSAAAQIGMAGGTDAGAGSAVTRSNLGVLYNNNPVEVPVFHGNAPTAPIPGRVTNWSLVPGGGSLYSNARIEIFGEHNIAVNSFLGESWLVAGDVLQGDSDAQLNFVNYSYNPATDQWVSAAQALGGAAANPSFQSSSSNYSTLGGIFRDGENLTDQTGWTRNVGRKEPPSIMTNDPQTGMNRYLTITKNSGSLFAGANNTGEWGYGRGVYVNSSERGNVSGDSRQVRSAVRALETDWLNTGNPSSQGWQGPYYIPLAPYLHLIPDGFEIIRDSRSTQPYWIDPVTGTPTGERVCRYRLRAVGTEVYILNSIQHPALVAAPSGSVSDADFVNNGQPFNGVICFAGDVRTRGVIPTDMQLTVVSMGTIYVEGSITRGLINCNGTRGAIDNSRITSPSRSAVMLMARDYVTINTTQFFGPQPGSSPAVKDSDILPDTPNAVELDAGEADELWLTTQFLFNTASGAAGNPSTWQPHATTYTQIGGGGLNPAMMFTSSADDGGPAFASLDIMAAAFADGTAVGARTYLFPTELDFGTGPFVYNAAASAYGFVSPIPVLGMGDPAINAYPKFETIGFGLLGAGAGLSASGRLINAGASVGDFQLGLQDPTLFRIRMAAAGNVPPKNWLLARSAVAPHDIRIEAAMVAEEGSFFVIPGPWFNSNGEDTRARWTADSGSVGAAQANFLRFQRYGNTPAVPFYEEPLDVRVQIIGAVSENMPAPIAAQAAWMEKWGWIPRDLGSTGLTLAEQHTVGSDPASQVFPNFTITYDPVLATGTADGSNPLRVDPNGWILPPMPRLPVSPTLAYFGDMNQ